MVVVSFKFVMEIANAKHPNSINNTVPICVFDCQDTAPNLHLVLSMYAPQIQQLQATTWKGKEIVTFAFGDYEYQTKMYGLSGASGQHPCLHCFCTKKSMDIDPDQRPSEDRIERSLATLEADFESYTAAGSRLNQAKRYNNVIRPSILPVALTHVAIPTLHLDLGISPGCSMHSRVN